MIKKLIFIISIITSNLFCMYIGNPSNPRIYSDGIFSKNKYFYIKAGYVFDNLYSSKNKDEFVIEDSTSTYLSLKSNLSLVSVNVMNWIDIYTFLGASNMKMDNQVFTSDRFCWCVGSKFFLYKNNSYTLSVDGKYLRTRQNVEQFIVDDLIFPILTPHFSYLYEEYQAACLFSYRINSFIPYLGLSYLYSTISPYPMSKGLIRYPAPYEDIIDDFITHTSINSIKWGGVVGLSIISS